MNVVNDRRASLDETTDIKPTLHVLVQKEFERGASIHIEPFPQDVRSESFANNLRHRRLFTSFLISAMFDGVARKEACNHVL